MQRIIAREHLPVEWDGVRWFLAMSQAKSLAACARSLGVDKSTLSRRIAALEASLGATLFVRTHEGMRLSATGEHVKAHAERMAVEVRALRTAAVTGGEQVSGVVRIATTEGMALGLVQGGLLDLRELYPSLEIELLGSNQPVDLARGDADLALRLSSTREAGLRVRVLARFGISLFASETYLRARGLPRNQGQLEGHDVLLPGGELSNLPEARWLAKLPGTRAVLRSSSMPVLVEASVRGHGLCAITDAWGQGLPGLRHVFDLEHIPPRPVWLVLHPDVAKRAAVRVVADRIAERFRSQQGKLKGRARNELDGDLRGALSPHTLRRLPPA